MAVTTRVGGPASTGRTSWRRAGRSALLLGMTLAAAGCWSDLGTLGGPGSAATDVNDHGVVVGVSTVDDDSSASHAFIRRPGAEMVDLNGDYLATQANAVNEHSVIVGEAYREGVSARAVMWDADGDPHELPVPTVYQSGASDLNDAGQVVGSSTPEATNERRAYVYDTTDGELTWLPFGRDARGVNEGGEIVGTACVGTTCVGALWTESDTPGAYDVVALPGVGGRPSASAEDINDAGQIVGRGPVPGPVYQAILLWNDPLQPPVEVPVPGTPYSHAAAIGDDGRIVGYAAHTAPDATTAGRAFVFDPDGGGLTSLGPPDRHSSATAINRRGQISGAVSTGEPPPDEEAPEPNHAVLFAAPR